MMSKRRSYTYTTPTDLDILGGRRSEAFYHTGNRKLRNTIAALLDGYNSLANPQARGAVVDGIVQSLKESGGRFLKFHTEVGVIEKLLAYSESLSGPDPIAHTKHVIKISDRQKNGMMPVMPRRKRRFGMLFAMHQSPKRPSASKSLMIAVRRAAARAQGTRSIQQQTCTILIHCLSSATPLNRRSSSLPCNQLRRLVWILHRRNLEKGSSSQPCMILVHCFMMIPFYVRGSAAAGVFLF